MIKIPKFLNEVHGEKSTLFDLTIIYFGALFVTSLVIFFSWPIYLSFFKYTVLIFLLIDISGGVIANLTAGTKDYYAARPYKRKVFIALHILQPLLLTWVFPDQALPIGVISALVMISAISINKLMNSDKQRVLSACLLIIIIALTLFLDVGNRIVEYVMILYAFKLVFSFAVSWDSKSSLMNKKSL